MGKTYEKIDLVVSTDFLSFMAESVTVGGSLLNQVFLGGHSGRSCRLKTFL